MPITCAPEELKQPAISKGIRGGRGIWLGAVRDKVTESCSPMGEAMNDDQESDPRGTRNQHSPKRPGSVIQ